MANVRIQKVGPEIEAEGEGMLMDLAYEKNLPIPFGCQSGRCGVCQVVVVEGSLADPGNLESAILEGFRCPEDVRLACQAFLEGDVVLRAVNE
ncbi:MAG: 2Fe-2S iron-sulfur cluster-binding protein [Planctomycetota bacterium]|jgi:ferredoxin